MKDKLCFIIVLIVSIKKSNTLDQLCKCARLILYGNKLMAKSVSGFSFRRLFLQFPLFNEGEAQRIGPFIVSYAIFIVIDSLLCRYCRCFHGIVFLLLRELHSLLAYSFRFGYYKFTNDKHNSERFVELD